MFIILTFSFDLYKGTATPASLNRVKRQEWCGVCIRMFRRIGKNGKQQTAKITTRHRLSRYFRLVGGSAVPKELDGPSVGIEIVLGCFEEVLLVVGGFPWGPFWVWVLFWIVLFFDRV